MAEIVKLTKDNYAQTLADTKGKLLVDFWATWCGPCKMMAPVLEELAGMDIPGLTIAKVNVDDENQLAMENQIFSIPTLKLFADGQPVQQQVGFIPLPELMAWAGLQQK